MKLLPADDDRLAGRVQIEPASRAEPNGRSPLGNNWPVPRASLRRRNLKSVLWSAPLLRPNCVGPKLSQPVGELFH